MKKLLSSAAVSILMVLVFSSCVYYVDRPYVYTNQDSRQQYPDDANYGYYPRQYSSFMILRIYDNRYVFYDDNAVIAVWVFQTDGTVIKRGSVIDGLVKVFYAADVPAAEILYRNDERDGFCRFYHRNGRPMEYGEYKNGVRYGGWKRFNDQGALSEEFVFNGNKMSYKMKAKAGSKDASSWEFDYLNKEHEYKKQVKQELREKDKLPGKYKKAFGENPYEGQGRKETPVSMNTGKPAIQQDNNGRWNNDVKKENAYGRDNSGNESKDFKWQDNKGGRDARNPVIEPAREYTPGIIPAAPYEKPGRGNDNNTRNGNDRSGKVEPNGNAYGHDKKDRPVQAITDPPIQASPADDPTLRQPEINPVVGNTPEAEKQKVGNSAENNSAIDRESRDSRSEAQAQRMFNSGAAKQESEKAESDEQKKKKHEVKNDIENKELETKETPVTKNRLKSDGFRGLKGSKENKAEDVTATAEAAESGNYEEAEDETADTHKGNTGKAQDEDLTPKARGNSDNNNENTTGENTGRGKSGKNKDRN